VLDLQEIFPQLKKYKLRLNPNKCTFGVEARKFLSYMLTNKGIETILDKCKAILEMKSLTCLKEVQQLTGRIAVLTRFLPTSVKISLPLFKALKKKEI